MKFFWLIFGRIFIVNYGKGIDIIFWLLYLIMVMEEIEFWFDILEILFNCEVEIGSDSFK